MALLSWFGSSRKDIWRKLSQELGGRYSEGSWRQTPRIDIEHAHWTSTLDTYMVMANNTPLFFTRLRAPFANRENWRLKLYRSNLFADVARFFGMQDLDVGQLQFDSEFVIKSNDERLAKAFFADAALREQIALHRHITLSVEDHEGWFGRFPPDTDELRLVVPGLLQDEAKLRQLFDLFAAALDRLCAIGSAYERKPGFSL